MYPFWVIKCEKALDIADDALEPVADLSKAGSITQFKSPRRSGGASLSQESSSKDY